MSALQRQLAARAETIDNIVEEEAQVARQSLHLKATKNHKNPLPPARKIKTKRKK